MLEIGTGSGYQSAYLANLTDKVWSIEIIKPLAERTRAVYDVADRARLYRVQGDHHQERRRLLRLGGARRRSTRSSSPAASTTSRRRCCSSSSPNGIMVIPVGPPGAQHVLKIVKQQAADGTITVARSDIYNGGRVVPSCRSPSSTARGMSQAAVVACGKLGALTCALRLAPGAGDFASRRARFPAKRQRFEPSRQGPSMTVAKPLLPQFDLDLKPTPALYLAVGLEAGAVIALQIGIMRIFSVGSWAHFGSLVVSLAMLGFGLTSAVDVHRQGLVRAPLARRRDRVADVCSVR